MDDNFVPDELRDQPGSLSFIDTADTFLSEGKSLEALYIAARGVSHNKDNPEGRLILAKIFFNLDCVPLAIREIKELRNNFPDISSLEKLLLKLAPEENVTVPEPQDTKNTKDSEVLAETEFDFSEIELMEEDD